MFVETGRVLSSLDILYTVVNKMAVKGLSNIIKICPGDNLAHAYENFMDTHWMNRMNIHCCQKYERQVSCI